MNHSEQQFTLYEIADLWERLATMTPGTHGTMDYGTGEQYTALEAHLVSYIADHPNCTSSDIAKAWDRTRGAISQTIQKLKSRGLIDGRADPENKKRIFLYLTPKGKLLDAKHREGDSDFWRSMLDNLEQTFSPQEVDKAFAVLDQLYRAMLAMRREME